MDAPLLTRTLSLRLDFRPVLVHDLGRLADVLDELAPGQGLGRRVDARIVQDLGADELAGREIGARVADAVDDPGVDLGLLDVVEEGIDRLDVPGPPRNADAV